MNSSERRMYIFQNLCLVKARFVHRFTKKNPKQPEKNKTINKQTKNPRRKTPPLFPTNFNYTYLHNHLILTPKGHAKMSEAQSQPW